MGAIIDIRQQCDLQPESLSGYLDSMSDQLWSVRQCLDLAIELSKAGPQQKDKYARYAEWFIGWLQATENMPNGWHKLLPVTVYQYIHHLIAQGHAPATIEHYTRPISMANNLFLENFPLLGRRMSLFKHIPQANPPEPRPLSIRCLKTAINASRVTNPAVCQVIALCGYAGLRIMEAVRLTSGSYDGDTLTICREDTKNRWSARQIPICDSLKIFLDSWIWVDTSGLSESNISHQIGRVFKVTNCDHQPKDLRKTFDNWSVSCGVLLMDVQAYTGHRPGSVMERNYLQMRNVEYLRANVVEKINANNSQ